MNIDGKQYLKRVGEQIKQYANTENMHAALSDSYAYWQTKYFAPRFRNVTGASNHLDFYATAFAERIKRTGNNRLASLGSGDGAVEVGVAQQLAKLGHRDFEFHLLELSPIQNDRARKRAADAGLAGHFRAVEADLNSWRPDGVFSGIMAHHTLHHVVELEHLFEAVREGLHPDGTFVTLDVIGRNGHMRWPEAYRFINLMWQFLPPKKRLHTILKRTDDQFFNHDTSDQGFEGIRAQDILPLLVKNFHFETFYAFGNLIDVFTSRGYGPNFNPSIKEDAGFIDFVEELNETLIDAGHIKPTRLCAVMGLKPVSDPRLYKGQTPEQMIRDPEAEPRP